MTRYNINKILCRFVVFALWTIPVHQAIAQTPGGTGLTTEVWLSADKVNGAGALPANGASVNTWSPVLAGGRSYVQNPGSGANSVTPTFVRIGTNLMNFQPHLNFGTDGTKLINTANLLNLTNAYYVFYVSRTANTGTNRVVFTFSANNGTARNNSVGWYNGNPYFALSAINKYHQGNGKQYGINASILPNTSTSTPYIYMNGVQNSTSFATGTRVMATGTYNMSIIGNNTNAATYPFTGDLQELIVLSAANGSTINSTDLAKINTYLAIKYGITLAAGNYVNTSGNTVWDRNRLNFTAYNNNIFGLARDNASGLHQKQARSADSKELTIFIGNNSDFADLNVNNPSNLLNSGDYLLLGSNINKSYVPYKYLPGDPTANFHPAGDVLDEEINTRTGLVFRAQATRSFPNVKIITGAMYVLVSPSDPNFAPAATRLYKVDENTSIANVTINDGDYISFALYEGFPGGLKSGLELWLAADYLLGKSSVIPDDDVQVSNWTDLSDNHRDFAQVNPSSIPSFSYNGMNYNPSVSFTVDDEDIATDDRQKKLASPNFPVVNTKSYYTFWVSEVDKEKAGATANGADPTGTTSSVVFTFNGGTADQNNHGWRIVRSSSTDPQAIERTSTGTVYTDHTTGNPNNKGYGVTSIMRPNVANINQTQYFNGIPNSWSANAAGSVMNATGTAVIGSATNVASGNTASLTNPFFGDIQEIIVYSGAPGTTMPNDTIQKIHSYLAIKYGISLDNQDLINSSDTIVWDGTGTKNSGYTKNVFGLARDKNSGLYVKQAASADYRSFSVFVGDELADLNVYNMGSLMNDEYIMFGSNGRDSLTVYDYEAGNGNFKNGPVMEDVNFRRNLVFKTQITPNGSGPHTVNMAAPARYVLVSPNDPSFAPANTTWYKVDKLTGYAMNVVLNDGDYIGFATLETAPGGVLNGLKLWLRADDLTSITKDGDDKVSVWRDQTSNNNHFTQRSITLSRTKTYPEYIECDDRMNFQPSIRFDVDAYLGIRRGPMSMDAPNDFTSFAVYYTTGALSNARLYTHGFGGINPGTAVTRYPAMGFAPGATVAGGGGRIRNDGTGRTDVNGNVVGFRKNTTALQMIHTQKQAKNGSARLTYDFGGWQDYRHTYTPALGNFGNGFRMARGATIGGASIAGTGSGSGSFIGMIPEIFFYEAELTSIEQDKIRTYLGIKYGITLDVDLDVDAVNQNYDYVLSDGITKVWAGNSAPHVGYHKNVVGLVRDDYSDMYINKARSSADGAIFTMMIRGHDLCGQGDSPELVNDRSGLFWGNNGRTAQINLNPNDPNVCGDMDFKLGRIWLVEKTNLDRLNVTILMAQTTSTSSFPYASAGYQVTLLLADSPAKLDANQWDLALPATFMPDLKGHKVDFVFTEQYTYMAIGVKQLPGACESCGFENSKTVAFNRDTWWPNGSLAHTFYLGDNFDVNVKTSITSPASFVAAYPRYSTQNSLREYRRGAAAPKMITEITPSEAAAAKFQIFNIDREGTRYQQVEIYGECDAGIIYPRLSPVMTQERRRSFDIAGNMAKAKRTPTSSYTGDAGKLNVYFEYPVEKIIIEESATGAASGTQYIGIAPITFSCPAPIPPFNEAGIAVSKQAPDTVKLCTVETPVEYTFRIFNANCSAKEVTLRDTLPAGMYWDRDLIYIDTVAIAPNTEITISNDGRILTIDSLLVPGAEHPFIFSALAIIGPSGGPGIYENQIWLETTIIQNNLPVALDPYPSADYYRGEGQKSRTVVVDGDRLELVTVSVSKSKDCYRQSNEIMITLQINNPTGQSIPDMYLDMIYNEEFTYVNNSVVSALSGIGVNPKFDMNGGVPYPGYFYFDNFTLPAGISTISFKVKAPVKGNLVGATDASGNPVDKDGNIVPAGSKDQAIIDFVMSYDFSTGTDNECLAAALLRANGDILIPHCSAKDYIITNKMLQPRLR